MTFSYSYRLTDAEYAAALRAAFDANFRAHFHEDRGDEAAALGIIAARARAQEFAERWRLSPEALRVDAARLRYGVERVGAVLHAVTDPENAAQGRKVIALVEARLRRLEADIAAADGPPQS